jgi:hypothetical protein
MKPTSPASPSLSGKKTLALGPTLEFPERAINRTWAILPGKTLVGNKYMSIIRSIEVSSPFDHTLVLKEKPWIKTSTPIRHGVRSYRIPAE